MKTFRKVLLTGTILTMLLVIQSTFVSAQVTIGANTDPDPQAVLDLYSNGTKGFLPPRVELVSVSDPAPFKETPALGMLVYNTGANLSRGVYTWNGSRWESTGQAWFYMPSIPFETVENMNYTVDLYQEFAKQFDLQKIKNDDAPDYIYPIPQRSDFDYYVIGHDADVFINIKIGNDGDNRGVMTYEIGNAASNSTYINIVFVLKNN